MGTAPATLRLVQASAEIGPVAPAWINTPYGLAWQATDAPALAARQAVLDGAPLYRLGTTGINLAAEGQFWSLEHPLSPGYAERYGLPPANVARANFIEAAWLSAGTPFVTRTAPPMGTNPVAVRGQSYRRVAWCFGGSKRGRIRMALDYYREAIEIAELLETEGYTDESGALKLAVASGATATEILMALRWHLERLGRTGRMNDETSARMRKLSAAIGVVLG